MSDKTGVSRRDLLLGAAAGLGVAATKTSLGRVLFQDSATKTRPVLGHGEHTYECIHDWLVPPADIKWGDTHGLAQDSRGFIYVSHTVHPTSIKKDAILVFDPNGKFVKSWGSEMVGGGHGLDLRKEGHDEFLYHCDIHRRLVVKTTLNGEVLWEKSYPKEANVYKDASGWCPTNVAFGDHGEFYVGDGYGSSFVFRYDKDGNYMSTIATPGSGPGQVSCPHGLWLDTRTKDHKLVVADRSNHRLQYFTKEGQHLGFVTEGMRQPCRMQLRHDLMLIPDLDSVVTILDKNNNVIASLGDGEVAGHPSGLRDAARDQFIPGKFIHPHGAIFLKNGDILVAEWVPIGRITRLRHVNA